MSYADLHADACRFHASSRPLTWRDVVTRIWRVPGFQAVAVYRLGRWLRRRRAQGGPARTLTLLLTPLHAALRRGIRLAYDIDLDPRAEIGPGLYIGHFGGIRVRDCRLGSHCAIQQEVRLEPAVAGSRGPWIGDDVWIGSHAQVLGAVAIGDGATIGAGAVVTRPAAPHCLLMGDPARVVLWAYDNHAFL